MTDVEKRALESYVEFIKGMGWKIPIPSEVYRVAFKAGWEAARDD